ncbi:MAG: NAD(P)H-binding protein [Phycisphaerae bacterium]|nr:NAD(P)H-binding protein [Phycisphaerae bacterium]
MDTPIHAVTGALGYTGRSITEQLLARGLRVRTLTNSPRRPNPFGPSLDIRPLAFDDHRSLEDSLRGVSVLYNTYWVRFNHKRFTFEQAVRNTKSLFQSARRAGVSRLVHVSILHADKADDLGYYRGKHELEDALRALDLPHAIIRPGVLFGRSDILVNNIAWVLRHLPLFGVFGDGSYRLRPLHVDDMATLMIDHAFRNGNTSADAVGPESFTYRELVETLASILARRPRIIPVPPALGHAVARTLNPFLRDIIITREEISGLMRGLLDSPSPVVGAIRLTDWATQHRDQLGVRYHSEVGRRLQRDAAYADVR